MASATDDVESLSSMNESAWDMIDERSATSDNEASDQVSRVATPMSEAPEPIYPEGGSLAGYDTGSENQDHQRAAKFSHSRKDSSSDPPDTARPFATAPKRQSILLENQTSYIKFQEMEDQETEVSFVLTEFNDAERKRISKEYSLGASDEIAGTVRQKMGTTGLTTSGPFKVIYVGPVEMKESVVNKIASALAASPGFSPRDSLNSSRVTVVPISSFADDSSPDVVLIDSMGIDMNIEECKSAKEDNQNITLVMTNHSKTCSTWDPRLQKFLLPEDYETPDLAIVYVPQRESSAAKMTRSLARNFFNRHEIPTLLISYDAKWKKVSALGDLDTRLPHLAVEAFNVENDKVSVQVLRRQAIDISTFVSIDSAQLSRSLALLIPGILTQSQANEFSSKLIADTPFAPTLDSHSTRTKRNSGPFSWLRIGIIALSILAMFVLRRDQVFQVARQSSRIPEMAPIVSIGSASSTTSVEPASSAVTIAVTRTISTSPSITPKNVVGVPVEELLKDNLYQNKSDKFQAQVVGDNHVIIRAPTWFMRYSNEPKIIIEVRRAKTVIPHELTALFNGVYALKFPQEHAHGSIEITLSTTSRVKVHEVFQVELGSPWLKISGWQSAALAMKDQLTEELFTARVGILKAYSHTNTRVQYFFKDAVTKADSLIKEAEKVSLGSFASTLQNTDQLLAQTKNLTTSLTDKLRAAAFSRTLALFSNQHDLLSQDLSVYSKKLSTMFMSQAKTLTTAATSLVTIGQDIQTYRETHFINEQKRLLQTWWSIFGVPSHLKAKMRQSQQDLVDEDIWSGRTGGRRVVKKARKENKKRAKQHGKHNQDADPDDSDEHNHPVRERYRRAVATARALKRSAAAHFDNDSDDED